MADYVKLKENADWYYANLDSLLPKYRGRFVGCASGYGMAEEGEARN